MTTPTRVQLSMPALNFSAEARDWTGLIDHVRVLDEVGVDRAVVSDHVVYGENLEEYGKPEVGGAKGGKQPTGPDGHWLEPLTLLTYFGAVTTNIRLGTNILIAALRRPVVLAKTLSTLDTLTNGRVDLGVGRLHVPGGAGLQARRGLDPHRPALGPGDAGAGFGRSGGIDRSD
ncbi:MAG TPA: LLM class flavin-dependent oxidoreductase, partial [Ilumatobacteraceae bacterium]|nr:LLM class flavin-dependent oxidoreductase [Ilumatobacteraceae bacterium]